MNSPNTPFIPSESADLDAIAHIPLRELYPQLALMPGEGPHLGEIPSSVRHRVRAHVELRWSAIGDLTVGEMLSWHATGEKKVRDFLGFLRRKTSELGHRSEESGGDGFTQAAVLQSIQRLAGWGLATGEGDLLRVIGRAQEQDAIEPPKDALEVLAKTRLEDLIDDSIRAEFDADLAIERLLALFDERDTTIIEERVFSLGRPTATLEELGERFAVTRERVRQLEIRIVERLAEKLGSNEFRAVAIRSADVARAIGRASTLNRAGFATPTELSLGHRLALYAAGPYEIGGDWIVHHEVGSVQRLVESAFESVAVEGVAGRKALEEQLSQEGVLEPLDVALSTTSRLKRFGDEIVEWGANNGDKAVAVLRLTGTGLTSLEIFEQLGEPGSLRGFRNAIQADGRIVRIGKDRYGLVEWGEKEYEGVVPAMIAEIKDQGGSAILADLASSVAEEFGVSANSVNMYASMSPAFVLEEGSVRMRRDDEPYEPETSLEATAGCWMVDGVWAYGLTVDSEVLRGSGRQLPEAFAVHLGVLPGQAGRIASPFGEIHVSWHQYPAIGSTRLVANALGAAEGDILFVRRITPSSIDFHLSMRPGREASAKDRLRFRLGIDGALTSWEAAVSDALGKGGIVRPETPALLEQLREKGEEDILAAVGELWMSEMLGKSAGAAIEEGRLESSGGQP